GDIRNCMVAMSQDETLLAKLFNYRFDSGRGLKGHSFGNLFLTAMTHLTGDFGHAVKLSAEVLAVAGRIYPSTASNVVLQATLADGQQVTGETRISRSTQPIQKIQLLPRKVKPLMEALQAIENADVITLGPGSLFTSVIPNMLVSGIPKAIAKSKATKVYFANLMTQPGETSGMTASQHVESLLQHCGRHRREMIDVCVLNSGSLVSGAVKAYKAKQARPVEIDEQELRGLGLQLIEEDLVRMAGHKTQAHGTQIRIRHDSGAIGAITIELAQQHRLRANKAQGNRSRRNLDA
ncbi:MAG: gluconeogenesis factor YvcK family protein, partial [Acidobacteriota bacterium]